MNGFNTFINHKSAINRTATPGNSYIPILHQDVDCDNELLGNNEILENHNQLNQSNAHKMNNGLGRSRAKHVILNERKKRQRRKPE